VRPPACATVRPRFASIELTGCAEHGLQCPLSTLINSVTRSNLLITLLPHLGFVEHVLQLAELPAVPLEPLSGGVRHAGNVCDVRELNL